MPPRTRSSPRATTMPSAPGRCGRRPRTRTDAAKDAIITKGYDNAFGARPLRREIQNQIEDPLAERMLMARFEAGDTIIVDAVPDGGLSIEKKPERQTVKTR